MRGLGTGSRMGEGGWGARGIRRGTCSSTRTARAPFTVDTGWVQVTSAPSLAKRTRIVPVCCALTLLPRRVALMLALPWNVNCARGRRGVGLGVGR